MTVEQTSPAVIITTDGKANVVYNHPTNLKVLQNVVDGYIELVRISPMVLQWLKQTYQVVLPDDSVMFCNEYGRAMNMPHNKLATGIFGMQLLGNVIVIGNLTPEEIDE